MTPKKPRTRKAGKQSKEQWGIWIPALSETVARLMAKHLGLYGGGGFNFPEATARSLPKRGGKPCR